MHPNIPTWKATTGPATAVEPAAASAASATAASAALAMAAPADTAGEPRHLSTALPRRLDARGLAMPRGARLPRRDSWDPARNVLAVDHVFVPEPPGEMGLLPQPNVGGLHHEKDREPQQQPPGRGNGGPPEQDEQHAADHRVAYVPVWATYDEVDRLTQHSAHAERPLAHPVEQEHRPGQ